MTANLTAEEIAAGYDAVAEDIWESPSLYRDALKLAPDVHGDVLDIGCGQGRFLEIIANTKPKVTSLSGCDISPRLVEMARARLPQAEFKVANALDLADYPDQAFDFVFMIGSLEHMIEHEMALQAAHRVLRDSGVLAVAVPNAAWVNYEKWKRHRTEFQPVDDYWFQPDELAGLMREAGFNVERLRGLWAMYRGNWIHNLEMAAAFFLPVFHRKMKLIGIRAKK